MVARGTVLPKRLRPDFIVEALLEIRFQSPVLTEVILGRLADSPTWVGAAQRRLPAYELPQQIRQVDPNLRYAPLFELFEAGDKPRALRVGQCVLSYHRTKHYPVWTLFEPELMAAADGLFDAAKSVRVERIGLRYLNALRSGDHGIQSVRDLDLDVKVAEDSLERHFNLNYTVVGTEADCTVRIATPEFLQGELPPDTRVFVDVDVFTKDHFATDDKQVVKNWILSAHEVEKKEFFHLLTKTTIESLREA